MHQRKCRNLDQKIPLVHSSFKLILWCLVFLQKPFGSLWDSGKINCTWDSLFSIFAYFQPNKIHFFSILWKTCLVSPLYVVHGNKVMLKCPFFCQSDLHTLWNFKMSSLFNFFPFCRSGLEQEDMRTLYKYLVSSLFPTTNDLEVLY